MTGFGGSRRHNDVRVLGYTILQPNTDDLLLYSGLHLYEEAVLGFPLPLRERDRVRGKAVATHLLIQTKSAVVWLANALKLGSFWESAASSWFRPRLRKAAVFTSRIGQSNSC